MSMHKAALNLFLAECTATALKEEIELKGSLASALQVRHKIRDTDLKRLFELADEAPPDTFRRCYYVYMLQLYAGSAYSTLEPVMSAAAHTLANVPVTPHWDPLKTHNFGAIYAAEPMNLFPGWSLTNARNNQFMLDPHVLMKHSDGAFSTDLHGVAQSSSKARTVGMQISGVLHPKDEQMTEKRLGGAKLTGLNSQYSPYSKVLKSSEPSMSNQMRKVHGEEKRTYDISQALKKFEKILDETKKTTIAGTAHYRLLFECLALQKVNSPTLLEAQTYWSRHRAAVAQEIDEVIDGMRREDTQEHAMTLRHYSSR